MARTIAEISNHIMTGFLRGKLTVEGEPTPVQGLRNNYLLNLADQPFARVLESATRVQGTTRLFLTDTVTRWTAYQTDRLNRNRDPKDVLLEIITTLREYGIQFERIPEIEGTKNLSPPRASEATAAHLSTTHDYLALVWGETVWYVARNGVFLSRETKLGTGALENFKTAAELLANNGQRLADNITLEEKNEIIARHHNHPRACRKAKERNRPAKNHRTPNSGL